MIVIIVVHRVEDEAGRRGLDVPVGPGPVTPSFAVEMAMRCGARD